ncbi:membrane protein [Asanoa hainanensis]|uniref:Membrane protein n=2 Tax=Asanoa hainanensis TaxID=560556 RepID=A0A239I0I6_9ACTN|nr:membrane protein [Asanoa hainanensis]
MAPTGSPVGYPSSAPPGYSNETPPGGSYPKTSPLPPGAGPDPYHPGEPSPYARPPGTPADAPFAPPDAAAASGPPPANPYAPPPVSGAGSPYGYPQPNTPGYGPSAPYNPYNAAPVYDQPVKKKRSNGPIIALVIVLALLFCGGAATAGALLIANAGNDDDPVATQPTNPALPDPDPADPIDPAPTVEPDDPQGLPTGLPGLPGVAGKTVVYEVTGEGRADITYVDDLAGDTRELKNQKLPWKHQFTSTEGSLLLTVSATRADGDNDGVGCRITVDGKESARNDGSIIGAFCIGTIFD